MSELVFLFDLDSAVLKQGIISAAAQKGICEELCGAERSFLQQAELLKNTPVSTIRDIAAKIACNEKVTAFIREHADRCYIVTPNFDVWIEEIVHRLGMEQNVFCSKTFCVEDHIKQVIALTDNDIVAQQMCVPFVAVGDGSRGKRLFDKAEKGILFSNDGKTDTSVFLSASHAVYDEQALVNFLEKLI